MKKALVERAKEVGVAICGGIAGGAAGGAAGAAVAAVGARYIYSLVSSNQ